MNWPQLAEDLHIFRDDYLGSKPRDRLITTNWYLIKTTIHKLMTRHIPQKSVGARLNLLYIIPAIKRKIQRRQRVYKRARKRGWKTDWEKMQKLRREINQELQQAYANYINRLLYPEPEPPSVFIATQVPPPRIHWSSTLKTGGRIRATVEEKANACNAQFQSVFSTEDQATMLQPHGQCLPQMSDLNITENGVFKLLASLNPARRQDQTKSQHDSWRSVPSPHANHHRLIPAVLRRGTLTWWLETAIRPPNLQEGI